MSTHRQDRPGNLARCIAHLCPQRTKCHRYQLAQTEPPAPKDRHDRAAVTVYTIFHDKRGHCRHQIPIPQP